jgi:hypothetical protein
MLASLTLDSSLLSLIRQTLQPPVLLRKVGPRDG